MKKIIILLLLLFQMTMLFAQQKEINKKGPTGIVGLQQPTKQYIPPANTNTNDQAYQSNCYSGLAFTVKNYGYDKDGKYYSWGIKVKNNYSKAVSVGYRLVVGGEPHSFRTLTYNIKPGETYDNDYGTIRALIVKNSSTKYEIIISEVCFEGQDCIRNGYADCNGKQAGKNNSASNNPENKNGSGNATNLQSAYSEFEHLLLRTPNGSQKTQIESTVNTVMKSNASEQSKLNTVNNAIKGLNVLINHSKQNSTTTSSGPTTQTGTGNDLTEYNRSKQEMEAKLQRENAEIQRQNQENTHKLNIWNNAIKEGVNAHNKGNYTEAKNQFSIALNNSTNETNRQNAQNYYNKSVEAEKSQVKIKAVGDLVQGTIQILGDAHEKKMQKLNAEIDEMKNKNAVIDEDQKINTLNDPKIFVTYCDYVAKNLEKVGFDFEKLENYTNIKDKEKTAQLKFKGMRIFINNRWSYGKMLKYITFSADNQNEYQKLLNSTFFTDLSRLNPHYNESNNAYDYTNIVAVGLEKQEDFLNLYNKGYASKNYIGFTNLSKKLDETAQKKLEIMGNETSELLEKAKLYSSGTSGIKKNYEKALELYQNAYNQINDKDILRNIGKLYTEGDEFLPKNGTKAEEYYLNYIRDNDKINPYIYAELANIYIDKKSSLYDLKKAENYFLKSLLLIEKEYNAEIEKGNREELKSKIIFVYSSLQILYYYDLKNPTLFAEYAEKRMQWDEYNYFTALDLAKLYSGKLPFEKKDNKKAKYWASKVCEIAENLAIKNNGSVQANSAKKMCELLKKDYKNLF